MLFALEVNDLGISIRDDQGKILMLVDAIDLVKKAEHLRLAYDKTKVPQKDSIHQVIPMEILVA